jgi:aspartokinase/homoserine dehydrogenase 1
VASLETELALEIERRDFDRIKVEDDVVILAAVGAGMKGTPGVSGRLFGSLGKVGVNVIAIAQGSSEFNISLVVAKGDVGKAIRTIHEEFELEKPD